MNDKKQHIENELSEIAPFLANLKKENDALEKFNVPDDYFNELSDSIFEKTILETENVHQNNSTITHQKRPSIWTTISRIFQSLLQPNLSVITTTVVVIAAFAIYLVNQPNESQMVELSSVEIEMYIEENIDAFDEEQLADLVTSSIDIETSINIEDIEPELLEEYIEENFIEDITIDELM